MTAPSSLKVLSLNVHKFVSPLSRKNFFNDLKELLEPLDLDIVCLQEFKTHFNGNKEKDTLEEFADQLWPHFSYGKNSLYDGGHHGNAILSKYPITQTHNYDITNHRFEKRGVLWAEVSAFEKSFSVFCTHFDLTQWGRKNQLLRLQSLLHNIHQPLIICGDFNDWNSKVFEHAKTFGLKEAYHSTYQVRAKTFPSPLPLLELDSIFYRDLNCTSSHVLNDLKWRTLSDHLPLYAEFEIGRIPHFST